MFAAEFGVGQVLWSLVWFFLFVAWIMLFFNVVGDVFRSPDLSGVSKALWVVALVFLPYLGVFAYLIVRGGSMNERLADRAQRAEDAARARVAAAVGNGSSTAQELERLDALHSRGVIDDVEFATLKARALA